MSWFSVLPVVATLLAEAPASVPPADPVVVPIGAGQPVAAPPAPAPQAPTGTDGAIAHPNYPPDRPARAGPAPPAQTVWYGWETLASDAAAIALFVGALELHEARKPPPNSTLYESSAKVALAAGLTVYAVGAPLVHGSRGDRGMAGKSVMLRLGLPLAGAALGALWGEAACQPSDVQGICIFAYGLVGSVGGGIAAMAIDAAVLARKRGAPRAAPTLQPVVVPIAGGARFVLGGRF